MRWAGRLKIYNINFDLHVEKFVRKDKTYREMEDDIDNALLEAKNQIMKKIKKSGKFKKEA